MLYLRLFHGRKPRNQKLDDWGRDGPVFEIAYFHTTYGRHIHLDEDKDLLVDGDLLYYDGVWYGDWSVFEADKLPDAYAPFLQKYVASKSVLPASGGKSK